MRKIGDEEDGRHDSHSGWIGWVREADHLPEHGRLDETVECREKAVTVEEVPVTASQALEDEGLGLHRVNDGRLARSSHRRPSHDRSGMADALK